MLYGDDRLQGITEVDVVVTVLGEPAACTVSRSRIADWCHQHAPKLAHSSDGERESK